MKLESYYINKIKKLVNTLEKIEDMEYLLKLIEDIKNKIPLLEKETKLEDMVFILLEDLNVNNEKKNIREFIIFVEDSLCLEQSKLSIEKLGRAISSGSSNGNFGLCVMTKYNCKLCGKEDLHSSSNIPKICKPCGEEIALNIVRYGYDFEKL